MQASLFKEKLSHRWQKILHSDVRQSTTKKIIATIVAITIAFFLALIIACSVCDTWSIFGDVLKTIFTSGYQEKFYNTLFSNMTILIVGGLSFIFAYKAGLFNIGISGQMVMGGTVGTIICHLCKIPTGLNQFVVILASMVAGAFIAGIIGALKAYLRVNEVVSSIMFNWIIYFMSILTLANLPIPHDASNLNTDAPADALLLRMNGESYIPLLIVTAIVIIVMVIVLNYSVFGRKLRVTGLSNSGALAAGYNIKANMIASMAISGLIAGLLGAMLYCGFSPNMPVTAAAKAIPQEGFNGISVGLISMCNPIATVPVSLFFSMVKTSVSDLQMLGIDNHISDIVFGIIVYGAAAIALFLNIKPYWLTLQIFRGKNYSKIKHEKNMTSIELLSLSGDQCSTLRKYYVFYKKHGKVKSSLRYPIVVRLKMFWANIRYGFVTVRSKIRVRQNKRKDIITLDKFYRQEMAHFIVKKGQLVIDKNQKHIGGWWLKLDDERVYSAKTKSILAANCGVKFAPGLFDELKAMNSHLKAHPFNDHEVRLVTKLAYLQNIRSGLSYRIGITKQNKLTYFTFMQTKKQVEEIGLNEIHSQKQFNLAHSAYFRAYHRTLQTVNNHYDQMFKIFPRKQQLNTMGIRFDSVTLNELYMRNLKEEIGQIAHLINSPLNKSQLAEVTKLVEKISKTRKDIEQNQQEVAKIRTEIKHLDKNDPNRQKVIKNNINKSKIYNNNIINDRKYITKLQSKINALASNARNVEETYETQKWLARKLANEKARKKLEKIAARRGI